MRQLTVVTVTLNFYVDYTVQGIFLSSLRPRLAPSVLSVYAKLTVSSVDSYLTNRHEWY